MIDLLQQLHAVRLHVGADVAVEGDVVVAVEWQRVGSIGVDVGGF